MCSTFPSSIFDLCHNVLSSFHWMKIIQTWNIVSLGVDVVLINSVVRINGWIPARSAEDFRCHYIYYLDESKSYSWEVCSSPQHLLFKYTVSLSILFVDMGLLPVFRSDYVFAYLGSYIVILISGIVVSKISLTMAIAELKCTGWLFCAYLNLNWFKCLLDTVHIRRCT